MGYVEEANSSDNKLFFINFLIFYYKNNFV